MPVVTIEVPALGNRCHLVHDGTRGPGRSTRRATSPPVEQAAEDAGVDIVAVADTHVHNDYVSGGLGLARRHGADYLLSADEPVAFERVGVRDGDVLAFGDARARGARDAGPHPPPPVLPGPTVPGRAGGAVLRRQPAARHRRPHRPRRPAAGPAPGRRPVGQRPALGAPRRRRPCCSRPTASAASAPAPGRRPRATGRPTIGGQRAPPGADHRPGRGSPPSWSPASARSRRTTRTWTRSTGPARARRCRPGRSPPTRSTPPSPAGRWVVDLRDRAPARRRPPAPGRSASSTPTSSRRTSAGWCPGAPSWCCSPTARDDLAPAVRDLAGIGIEGVGDARARAGRPPLDARLPPRRLGGVRAERDRPPTVVVDVRQRDEYADRPPARRRARARAGRRAAAAPRCRPASSGCTAGPATAPASPPACSHRARPRRRARRRRRGSGSPSWPSRPPQRPPEPRARHDERSTPHQTLTTDQRHDHLAAHGGRISGR